MTNDDSMRGVRPVPAACDAPVHARVTPDDPVALSHPHFVARAHALLADAGSLTVWQFAAAMHSCHPDALHPRDAPALLAALRADGRFTVAPLPRPSAGVWGAYRAAYRVGPRPTARRQTPLSYRVRAGASDGDAFLTREMFCRPLAPDRRGAVRAVEALVRQWRRSPALTVIPDQIDRPVVSLRRPRVRIPPAMLFHHLVAVEVGLAVLPRERPGWRVATIYCDSRMAQRDLADAFADQKRPDLWFSFERQSADFFVELVTRQYDGPALDAIAQARDNDWVLCATSRAVAARVQTALGGDVYHV